MAKESPDDMVLRPVPREHRGMAFFRGKEERATDKASGPRSLFRNIHRKIAKDLIARRLTARYAKYKIAQVARLGFSGPEAALARNAARGAKFLANPVVLATVAIVVGAAVAARLATGRSFENISQQVNKMLLGDTDDAARAGRKVRNDFFGNDVLVRFIGRTGEINSDVAKMYDLLYQNAVDREKGKSNILEDKRFQVNGLIDMLILRLERVIREAFSSSRGIEAKSKITSGISKIRNAESAI